MFSQVAVNAYVADVLRRNELYLEVERVRQVLIDYTKRPCEDAEEQMTRVQKVSQLFRALLLAKQSRQEVLQNVGNNNGGNT